MRSKYIKNIDKRGVGTFGATCAGPTAAAAEDTNIVFAAAAADKRGVGTDTKNVGNVTGGNGIKIVEYRFGRRAGAGVGPLLLGI